MAENIIEIRPEGTNDYADILYPKTRADAIVETTNQKVMTAAERTKLGGIATGAQVNTVTSVAGKTGAVTLAKGDVGLSLVENYGIATAAEAQAGTANNKYITPLRMKEGIAGAPLKPYKLLQTVTFTNTITPTNIAIPAGYTEFYVELTGVIMQMRSDNSANGTFPYLKFNDEAENKCSKITDGVPGGGRSPYLWMGESIAPPSAARESRVMFDNTFPSPHQHYIDVYSSGGVVTGKHMEWQWASGGDITKVTIEVASTLKIVSGTAKLYGR